MNERRRMIQDAGFNNAALAAACKFNERTVTRWVAGDSVSKETHQKIMNALGKKRKGKLRAVLDDEWSILVKECPDFIQAISRIADLPTPELEDEIGSGMERKLLDAVCEDVERQHGSRILSPALSKKKLSRCALTHEQLDYIESFFGHILLFAVNDDHQYTIDVDGVRPMTIRGVVEGELARLLVHYAHPNTVGPMSVTLENEEIQPSPHTLFFKDPVSAEISPEEASQDFLYYAAERLEPAKLSRALDEHADKASKVALESIQPAVLSYIKQRNRKENHIVGIGGLNTPKFWTSHLKTHILPDLRVAQLATYTDNSDTKNNVFVCDEYNLRALIVDGVVSILDQRHELESKTPRSPGAKQMTKTINDFKGASIGSVSTGDHATHITNNVNYATEMAQVYSLLRKVQTELQANGLTELAQSADELSQEEDAPSLIERAGEFVQAIEKPASSGARLLSLVLKLKSSLASMAAAVAAAGVPGL